MLPPYLFSVPSFLALFQIEFFKSILGAEPSAFTILNLYLHWNQCDTNCLPRRFRGLALASFSRQPQAREPMRFTLYSCQWSRYLQRRLKTCTTSPPFPHPPAKWHPAKWSASRPCRNPNPHLKI